MNGRSRILCLWPGLSALWLRGDLSSLSIAIGFSVLLNSALVSTFLWPDVLGATFSRIAWPVIGLVWVASGIMSFRFFSTAAAEISGPRPYDTLFIEAQNEYLRGEWERAELILARLLKVNHRDIEARLLLATILRRSKRLEEAKAQLDVLTRFDDSVKWNFEIDAERTLGRAHLEAQRIEDEDDLDLTADTQEESNLQESASQSHQNHDNIEPNDIELNDNEMEGGSPDIRFGLLSSELDHTDSLTAEEQDVPRRRRVA